jgi:hypothetical protein
VRYREIDTEPSAGDKTAIFIQSVDEKYYLNGEVTSQLSPLSIFIILIVMTMTIVAVEFVKEVRFMPIPCILLVEKTQTIYL